MNPSKSLRNSLLYKWLQKPSISQEPWKSPEDIALEVAQVKALILRFLNYNWSLDIWWTQKLHDYVWNLLSGIIDEDLFWDIQSQNETQEQKELKDIIAQVKEKLWNSDIYSSYNDYKKDISGYYRKLLKLMKYYSSGKITSFQNNKKQEIPLNDLQKNTLARQIIRLLELFKFEMEEQIQNIHNQVAAKKRDYTQTDKQALETLHKKLKECNNSITQLVANNYEVAIQLRIDQVIEDSKILKRQNLSNSKNGKKWGLGYLETRSRMELIYGNETSNNYVLACLRGWQNVEFFGPTGTGKTKLAIHAAKSFSSKDPVVVPGWLWVNKTTFYGSSKDLGKRNPWALIKCLEEDRILIIDEDNAIDPRQMKEIKYILWLKSGDVFIHPDTGDKYIVPPHFRVVVTRNEKGKHHTDRFDLPVEYRREFTHGSFEIDYYTPAEAYERFLIPKLINADGSIDLSLEEVGWDINTPGNTSPVLALVKAAKEIQIEFKNHKLTNSVFESGYMIEVLDQFKEMRFKSKSDGSKIEFLEYLEQKLVEFIKRPIGNKDRKILIQKLYEQWFFRGYKNEVFQTPGEWFVFTDDEFNTLTSGERSPHGNKLFKSPSGNTLSPREVALLDPFHQREIKEPVHPLKAEIDHFSSLYKAFCTELWVRPVSYSHHSFESAKWAIIASIKNILDEKNINNAPTLKMMLDTFVKLDIHNFIEKLLKLLQTIQK